MNDNNISIDENIEELAEWSKRPVTEIKERCDELLRYYNLDTVGRDVINRKLTDVVRQNLNDFT